MKRQYRWLVYVIILSVLVPSVYSLVQGGGYPDFELVESVPIETVLDNPNIRNTAEVWLEMINGAKKTLDIEQFYISNEPNESLEPIIQAIISAGRRGVQVRIIAEMKFYKTYPETLDRLKQAKNISVRLIDFGKLAGGVQHAKYFIVDKKQVFVGSQNFDWRALSHIHELGLRIDNADCAKIFGDVFELDWNLAEKNDARLLNDVLIKKQYSVPIILTEPEHQKVSFVPVYSPTGWIPDESLWDEPKLIELIDSANQELVLQVLTYNPKTKDGYYAELDNALRRAAARGVKVKLVVSDWSKRKPQIFYLQSLAVLPNIEVKLSTIPQYSGGFIPYARVEHCKYLVADSRRSWLGTSNWEKGYFYDSRNLGVIIESERISELLHQIFMKSWNSPYTYYVKPEEEYQPPRIGE
ncbi:MAG: phospholipase D-like domain-containing protein [bacterium]|nr:phospholipase D-like domain-containing protein [bacterium]